MENVKGEKTHLTKLDYIYLTGFGFMMLHQLTNFCNQTVAKWWKLFVWSSLCFVKPSRNFCQTTFRIVQQVELQDLACLKVFVCLEFKENLLIWPSSTSEAPGTSISGNNWIQKLGRVDRQEWGENLKTSLQIPHIAKTLSWHRKSTAFSGSQRDKCLKFMWHDAT